MFFGMSLRQLTTTLSYFLSTWEEYGARKSLRNSVIDWSSDSNFSMSWFIRCFTLVICEHSISFINFDELISVWISVTLYYLWTWSAFCCCLPIGALLIFAVFSTSSRIFWIGFWWQCKFKMLEMLMILLRGVMISWQSVAVSCFENVSFILLF